MHLTRIYLRASTDHQDAARAREQVEAFAAERQLVVAATYTENESGAKLATRELFRLLSDSKPGDALLVEQVDRLSRLTDSDWRKLCAEVEAKGVRIIALDLPTSWMMTDANGDDFTARMFGAINGMMLDMLAAVARKNYEDRRRRQAQGTSKAKAEGKYIAAGPKMQAATRASAQCCAAGRAGQPYRRRRAAAAPPLTKSPAGARWRRRSRLSWN